MGHGERLAKLEAIKNAICLHFLISAEYLQKI